MSDDQIRDVILRGGRAIGKSAQMPATPALADEPEVTTELVRIVRGFGVGR